MSVIKDAKTPELYRSPDLTTKESEYLDSYSKKSSQGELSWKVDSTLGGFIGLNNWVSCLGPIHQESGKKVTVMYFPVYFRSVDETKTYCEWLKANLGIAVRYLGEIYLGAGFYGGNSLNHVRSHAIALDHEPYHNHALHFILMKATLIRYVYRTNHYEEIILKMYEIVKAGIGGWDAVILAHQVAFANNKLRDYSNDRGLVLDSVPLMWPRTYEEVGYLFSITGPINSVFTGLVGNPHDILINFSLCKERSGQNVSSNRHPLSKIFLHLSDYKFFANPHHTINTEIFKGLLLKKSYNEALEFWGAYLQQLRPILNLTLNPEWSTGPLNTYPFFKCPTPCYGFANSANNASTSTWIESILKFIDSFKK
jgi:hypothetical protein